MVSDSTLANQESRYIEYNPLMLSMLGTNFSRLHFEILFLFVLEEKDMTFRANCLTSMNHQSLFCAKKKTRKISSIYCPESCEG